MSSLTMAAIPLPLKRSSVRSQKDLNPCSSNRLSFSKARFLSIRHVLPHALGGGSGDTYILKRVLAKVKDKDHSMAGALSACPKI